VTSLRGGFNGWGDTALSVDASFGGGACSAVTVTGVSGAPAEYKFYSSDGAVGWLGAGIVAAPNASKGVADKSGGGNLTLHANAAKRYTFRIRGYDSWWLRDYVVMETDAEPASISSVADDHALGGGAAPVTVTVTTGGVLSTQESVYVRWSADAFATSSVVAANGSGTSYMATIPAQARGAAVSYYAFTSAMPLGVVQADPDLCTLRGANNGGSNYGYTATSALRVSSDGGASWCDADYTTSKFFLDERAGQSARVIARYAVADPGAVAAAEVFTNLGRRDWADVDYTNAWISGDGFADGICPPDGNLISTNDAGAYFTAFAMRPLGGGVYEWTGVVSRCGAYRLTARHQTAAQSPTNWSWYAGGGCRDHAVVASPGKALSMTLYELNALTVNADAASQAGRSTFASLTNADNGKFNLNHLDFLQANCLWFQPIHPSAATARGNPDGYVPGSPYATRDYFAVSPWMGSAGTEESAMAEFTNFVALCDAHRGSLGTVNVMLDGVFNHTAWDAEMGQGGMDLGLCASKDDLVGATLPGWYARVTDYGLPATYFNGVYDNDVATAPDRGDFGKWPDVAELFFGRYAALVRHNPENNGDYLSEGDWYDFAGMGAQTKQLWRYFAYYADYWLSKTGHPCTNGLDAAHDDRGIDGLRCDFAQGLPPQFWEYFVNHTRRLKWNFVFMAETLDGGKPGYRSNRHFDLLNESIVFKFTQEHIAEAWQFKQAYENRRSAYGGGAILLNLTGHDEVMPESDPWMTASRHGCNAMIDGLPMIFYGQERGIVPATGTTGGANQGFEKFELNFGKYIVHFKQWNKATFWETPPAFSAGLDQWYARVNWARLNSQALRSPGRYFLSRRSGGGDNPKILAAAKYGTYGAGPSASNDVVLAFALILDAAHTAASETYDLQGPWPALGLQTNRLYNVRNLASSDAAAYVWPAPKSGQELYDSGVWVGLAADSGGAITRDGALVQLLRIVDLTAAAQERGTRLLCR
jgi:hypothetical protein